MSRGKKKINDYRNRLDSPLSIRVTTPEIMNDSARRLAEIRQQRSDPGSPCMECRQESCPPICKRKHSFELERRRSRE